jgi:hypothetical protein
VETGSVLLELLREAEAELARIRVQRGELDRAERLASERVAHLRALVELETGPASSPTAIAEGRELTYAELVPTERRRSGPRGTGSPSEMRAEDIAAEVLSERGPLHYRDLWDAVAQRGGNIVSGNPAAVLLTRISRDDRFAKDQSRGVYRLTVSDEPTQASKRRRRRARRARTNAPAVPE